MTHSVMRLLACLLLLLPSTLAFEWSLVDTDCNGIDYRVTLLPSEYSQGSYIRVDLAGDITGSLTDPLSNFFSTSQLSQLITLSFKTTKAPGNYAVQLTTSILDSRQSVIRYPEGTAADQATRSFTVTCYASSGSTSSTAPFSTSSPYQSTTIYTVDTGVATDSTSSVTTPTSSRSRSRAASPTTTDNNIVASYTGASTKASAPVWVCTIFGLWAVLLLL